MTLNSVYTKNRTPSWVKKLEAITSGIDNLMTFQLEKIWLTSQPILFLGVVEDIQIEGKGYKIDVRNSLLRSPLFVELSMRISCTSEITEGFIQYMSEHKEDFEFEKNIAVIAKINAVLKDKKLEEGNMKEIKVGLGECIALLPSTNNYSFEIK